jgi:hypothetical protein
MDGMADGLRDGFDKGDAVGAAMTWQASAATAEPVMQQQKRRASEPAAHLTVNHPSVNHRIIVVLLIESLLMMMIIIIICQQLQHKRGSDVPIRYLLLLVWGCVQKGTGFEIERRQQQQQ